MVRLEREVEDLFYSSHQYLYRNSEHSEDYLFKALRICKINDMDSLMHETYWRIGEVNRVLGKHDNALVYLRKSFINALDKNNTSLKARNYQTLGAIHLEFEHYSDAMNYFLKSQSLYREIGDKEGDHYTLAGIGEIQLEQNRFIKAKESFQKLLDYGYRSKNFFFQATAYNLLAKMYSNPSNPYKNQKLAKDYYEQAIERNQTSNNKLGMVDSYEGLAKMSIVKDVSIARGDWKKSLGYYNMALKAGKRADNKKMIADITTQQANIYKALKKYETAEKTYQNALKLARAIPSLSQMNETILQLSQLYEEKGDYYKALSYYKLAKEKRISMNNNYLLQELKLIESNYEDVQNAQVIARKDDVLQTQFIIILGISSFLFLMLGLIYLLFKYNKAKDVTNKKLSVLNQEITSQKEEMRLQAEELKVAYQHVEMVNQNLEALVDHRTAQLQKSNDEMDTFLYRTSHDFRRPLTTLMGLSQVAQLDKDSDSLLQLFEKVNVTVEHMDEMLHKLQMISQLDMKNQDLEEIDFEGGIQALILTFSESLESKGIVVDYNVDVEEPFVCYREMFFTILHNLLDNAIKFSKPSNGKIVISIDQNDDKLCIRVADNGVGIIDNCQKKIFNMYYRGNQSSTGSGIGLFIVKKAVERLEGEIKVESKVSKGSAFAICLPYSREESNSPSRLTSSLESAEK
ncbi:tetratricopeptide repeat-containing sensor histidine kinase [Aureibacter tunicatorum]|uniref:histidine kinase n=1 Tax=Aureibacter tunicatorum TaxID=866807 RepID=A0AAE3XR47_9BACT|nr:ATP-binding protein [Aureibacter tunicatorum]MDR6240361.1 signal transduction histidine kinase [Aureibacter tunicatorum]